MAVGDRGQQRRDQLLVALQTAPLDRVRLMKTAFLVWHRQGRPEDGPFNFTPYLYGPCAFDLYGALDDLQRRGLVAQPVAASSAPYWLTEAGREAADDAARRLGKLARTIEDVARWTSRQGFQSLLRSVYAEAPDFATRSVLRR